MRVQIAQSEAATFELRVDVEAGDWIVVMESEIYRSADKETLHRYVRDLLKSQRAVTWTRYLVIDYEAEGPGNFGSRRRYSAADERYREIASISLDWEVWDYSDPIQHPGQSKPRIKSREVFIRDREPSDDDGIAGRVWTNDGDLPNEHYGTEGWLHGDAIPSGAVLYTAERYALLREIRAAMARLDARLADLFRGATPAELAAKLDRAGLAAGISGLLAAPKGSESE